MATRMNRFSPALRGTPVVAREDGEERDIGHSAALNDDPAPADYRKQLLAYEAGKQAKADGLYGLIPYEYLEHEDLCICWEAGWLGQSMPKFGED